MKLKNISILTLFATAATLTCSAQLITTDFEDVDFTTSGSFPAGKLKNWTTALAVSATGTTNTWVKGGGSGNSSVLQPVASGSVWINPVPAEIGDNFGDIDAGDSFWLDTGIVALAATEYEFTVTQFTRDNIGADGSSLILGFSTLDNFTGDTVSATFAAIADSTLTTRTFTLDTATNSEFVGDTLRLYMAASGGDHVSIDNLTVTAIPEPSSFALLSGILALSSIMLRRR